MRSPGNVMSTLQTGHSQLLSEQIIANHVLQLLVSMSQWSSEFNHNHSMVKIINEKSGSELHNLSYLDFQMLNELASKIMNNIEIKVDASAIAKSIDELARQEEKRQVVHNLIIAQAPQPLMQSLFEINGQCFSRMRKALSVASKGGRPRALSGEQSVNVEACWNKYIELLMREEKYRKGEEAFLIGETIYSIHQETRVPILDFYPLLADKCSSILECVDFEKKAYPILKSNLNYGKHTNSLVLSPTKRYLSQC